MSNTNRNHRGGTKTVVNVPPSIEKDLERLVKLLGELPEDRQRAFKKWLEDEGDREPDLAGKLS